MGWGWNVVQYQWLRFFSFGDLVMIWFAHIFPKKKMGFIVISVLLVLKNVNLDSPGSKIKSLNIPLYIRQA